MVQARSIGLRRDEIWTLLAATLVGRLKVPAYIRLILTGFFYVVGHGLDPEYLKSLLQLGHRFFDLPQNVKESIHISKSMDGVRGWQKVTYQLEISVVDIADV